MKKKILALFLPGWPSAVIGKSAASVQFLCSVGIQAACVVSLLYSRPWDSALRTEGLCCLLMNDIQFPRHFKLQKHFHEFSYRLCE